MAYINNSLHFPIFSYTKLLLLLFLFSKQKEAKLLDTWKALPFYVFALIFHKFDF